MDSLKINQSSHSTQQALSKISIAMLDPLGRFAGWNEQLANQRVPAHLIRFDAPAALLESLEHAHVDVVVLACSMRAQHELSLMKQCASLQPNAIKVFIGADIWSAVHQQKAIDAAHRVYDANTSLGRVLEAAQYLTKITRLLNRSSLRNYVSTAVNLPTPSDAYIALSDAIESDVNDLTQITDIVESEPAVVAQIMRQVNSAYFGYSRNITSLKEAITLLGVRNLRSMVLSAQLMEKFSANDVWQEFCLAEQSQRGLLVGRLAQVISRKSGVSKAYQDQAFLAGLLHDLGIQIMVHHDPEQYKKLLVYAAKKQKPIYLVEKAAFGFFHGEVAASLLALWNIAPQVVEAVMLHHVPHLSKHHRFTPLTAVHVADSLLPSVESKTGGSLASQLSKPYLEQLGLTDELPQWQIIANDYRVRLAANQ